DIYLPVVLGMAIAAVGITTLPQYVASYREKGVLRRFATTPLGATRLLVAQILVQGLALVVAVALAVTVGMVLFDISAPSNIVAAVLAVVLALVGVAAVGMLIAALAPSARVATGISMLVFFPLLVVAGVWTPGPAMPDVLATIGEYTPVGAGVQGLQEAFAGNWPSMLQIVVPLVWAVVAGSLAAKLFRWS
ncbi:MAG TPA: ABC transporter permease, partial [Jiangellaceae bacterium]|nr:ABC transporter permease [Jiangellaceae bacterium]